MHLLKQRSVILLISSLSILRMREIISGYNCEGLVLAADILIDLIYKSLNHTYRNNHYKRGYETYEFIYFNKPKVYNLA